MELSIAIELQYSKSERQSVPVRQCGINLFLLSNPLLAVVDYDSLVIEVTIFVEFFLIADSVSHKGMSLKGCYYFLNMIPTSLQGGLYTGT